MIKGTPFQLKYLTFREIKNSILCVGLDPALPEQRKQNIISTNYLKYPNENEVRLNFCLDLIEDTKQFTCAYKTNQQYIAGFTAKHHQKLTNAIRKAKAISILDLKLNDIGDSMHSALFHIRQWGYDAITYNPLLGNMEMIVHAAHREKPELGIIVLVLTSNSEAPRFQKEARINGKPLYIAVAEDVHRFNADGCVAGATGHITEDELRTIRKTVGEDKILVVPGIGAQKGDPIKVIKTGGTNLLITVGRDIIYSQHPREKAQKYDRMFKNIRKDL